jgi:hypothetical protein
VRHPFPELLCRDEFRDEFPGATIKRSSENHSGSYGQRAHLTRCDVGVGETV